MSTLISPIVSFQPIASTLQITYRAFVALVTLVIRLIVKVCCTDSAVQRAKQSVPSTPVTEMLMKGQKNSRNRICHDIKAYVIYASIPVVIILFTAVTVIWILRYLSQL